MKQKEEQTKNQPAVKKPTLKEKISAVVDGNEDKDELKKAVFDLVQRVLYPDQFCPECDDRLFLNGNTYNCLNCGFSRGASVQPIAQPTQTTQPATSPQQKRPTGKVPEQVENVIAQATEAVRNPSPTAKGDRIRKLAEQLGDSSVAPTPHDTDVLKGADPNVRDVNWV